MVNVLWKHQGDCSTIVYSCIYHFVTMPSASWEDLAADKRARLEKSIPDEWKFKSVPIEGSVIDLPEKSGILSPSEIKITNSSATELVAQLANGTLKSVDVTLAFCKRAALAHQLVALAQARELDRYFETHKKPVGPLHGLPISLKDQLRVKLDKVRPHPPITRGVEIVRSTLEKDGHTVAPWTPYKHAFAVDLANKIYAADGSTHINASGEPAIPNIKDLMNPNLPKADLNEVWDAQLQKWRYQCEYLDKWREWEERTGKELDAIIAPVAATAAARHNQFRYYGYATVFNVLDYTSVVVPVTYADKAVDHRLADYQPVSDMDKAVYAEYDPEVYHGAPVAVQIIGRRLSEERTLAIAEYVGKLLGH
ncbi:unnamed protein product [Aspergillus oryzae var. brunneus]|uniref:Unnamed protein product n=1 Tax=Aspergillus oryzae var. brunneus TaxID=332754 RepID=A0ABQ6KWC6_ASPOZ|nr:unnamed protein product [Aspergillus oryzae var. brunneus]